MCRVSMTPPLKTMPSRVVTPPRRVAVKGAVSKRGARAGLCLPGHNSAGGVHWNRYAHVPSGRRLAEW